MPRPIAAARAAVLVLAFALGLAAAPAGALGGAEQQVNTYTSGNQSGGAVAGGGGQFVVVWSSAGEDGGAAGIYARRYGADGAPLSGEIHINTTIGYSFDPAVAVAPDGRFAVVWIAFDGDSQIVARTFAADGTPLTGEIPVTTTGATDQPAVALDAGGNAIVAWHDERVPGSQEVLGRRYAITGAPLTGQFPIGATALNEQQPSVAAQPGGTFVATWGVYHPFPDDDDDVVVARFAADGTPLTAAAPIGDDLGNREGNAIVASAPDGAVVVASSTGGGATAQRRYAADLTPRGALAVADDDRAPGAEDDVVGAGLAADGSAAIAMERRPGSTGTGSDMVVRRFGPDGAPAGAAERLNTSDGGYRTGRGGLAVLPDGALGAAWTVPGPPDGAGDGDADGVFARFGGGGGRAPGPAAPAPAPASAVTPPVALPAPARRPTTPAAAKPKLPSFGALVTLASTKRCVSRRHFLIRLHQPKKGTRIASATVVLQGKKVATRKGKHITSPIDLRGLPKGRFTVKITIVTTDHHTIKGSRTYRTCDATKAAPKHHKV
jgi:hypothetical protein